MEMLNLAAASDGRIFGLDSQMLISIGIQLFNACLLSVVLSFILYKPVRKFLNKRTEGIEAQINNAENNAVKANELKEFYEKKLEALESDRLEVLETAKMQAAQKRKQMLLDTEKEIAAVKKQALADIQSERENAGEETRLNIIEVATVIAEKFVVVSLDDNAQNRLFDETMAELENVL